MLFRQPAIFRQVMTASIENRANAIQIMGLNPQIKKAEKALATPVQDWLEEYVFITSLSGSPTE